METIWSAERDRFNRDGDMQIDETGWILLLVAFVCFSNVAIGLMTGKILGIAFRSRFIARKKEEPILFGCSLWLFGVFGAFFVYAVISVGLGWFEK